MADKIKKFFKNKKLDTNFKRAGPGYKLNESSSASIESSQSNDSYLPIPSRSGLTQETKQAAAAALARLERKKKDSLVNKSFSAVQAQVRRELAAEREKVSSTAAHESIASQQKLGKEIESSSFLAVTDVFFKCPIIGPQILTQEEWSQKIREFLNEELEREKGLAACLILHSLNQNQEKVKTCIDIITKYFQNILENPAEEKYRKIRMSNKIYQDKVMPMEGALQILEAAGFEIKQLPHGDYEENFLVYPENKLPEARDTFEMLIDALRNAEPITLELDRNLQVLLPRQAKERSELPDMFFNLTVEELRREQQSRTEAFEKSQMLRTKAMREKDEKQETRKYKFGVIRIRFPEDILLQGTFGVHEKFSSVIEFVKEALSDDKIQFTLTMPTGQQLNDENATLLDLKLIPAAVLNFRSNVTQESFLKPEVLILK